jgi:hypothetical protein
MLLLQIKLNNPMSTNSQQEKLLVRDFGQLQTVQPKEQLTSFLTNVKGKDIFARCAPALTYLNQNEQDGLAVDRRGLQSAPGTTTTASDSDSRRFYGDNFASNNYLGLAQHPSTV